MRWKTIPPIPPRETSCSIESGAGYVVVRCETNGKPNGRYITMLGRLTKTRSPVVIGGHDSAEEAKAFCQQHYDATRASAA